MICTFDGVTTIREKRDDGMWICCRTCRAVKSYLAFAPSAREGSRLCNVCHESLRRSRRQHGKIGAAAVLERVHQDWAYEEEEREGVLAMQTARADIVRMDRERIEQNKIARKAAVQAKKEEKRRAYEAWKNRPKVSRKESAKRHKCRKYGIATADYDRMYAEQGGACLICREQAAVLAIDHCHKTGKVRGLLCMLCNPGLGCFRDRTDLLDSAKAYLLQSLEPIHIAQPCQST